MAEEKEGYRIFNSQGDPSGRIWRFLDETDWIRGYFLPPEGNFAICFPNGEVKLKITSSFLALLHDVRDSGGRCQTTGIAQKNIGQGSWLAAIGYLMLIEKIKNYFYGFDLRMSELLKDYGLSENDADVIHRLRNALVHRGSLVCNRVKEPNGKMTPRPTWFELHQGKSVFIRHGSKWNGEMEFLDQLNDQALDKKRKGIVTSVSVTLLGEMFENRILKDFESKAKKGSLSLKAPLRDFVVTEFFTVE